MPKSNNPKKNKNKSKSNSLITREGKRRSSRIIASKSTDLDKFESNVIRKNKNRKRKTKRETKSGLETKLLNLTSKKSVNNSLTILNSDLDYSGDETNEDYNIIKKDKELNNNNIEGNEESNNNNNNIEEDEELNKKKRKKRNTKIKYIEDLKKRRITFSKRKGGISKKLEELSILCGCDVFLCVVSESGRVYNFVTPSLDDQELKDIISDQIAEELSNY
jgi:hypothetical protein